MGLIETNYGHHPLPRVTQCIWRPVISVICYICWLEILHANLHITLPFTGMADLSDTSRWWFNCVWVSECVSKCVSLCV